MTEAQQQPVEFVQLCECGKITIIRIEIINGTISEDTPAASGVRGRILPPPGRVGYFNPNPKNNPGNGSSNDSGNGNAQSQVVKPPTPGQLEFARDICSVVNKPLPRECEESYDACYRFIGDNKAEFYDKKPKKPAAAGAGAGAKPASATANAKGAS